MFVNRLCPPNVGQIGAIHPQIFTKPCTRRPDPPSLKGRREIRDEDAAARAPRRHFVLFCEPPRNISQTRSRLVEHGAVWGWINPPLLVLTYTGRPDRMSHRKWGETKQQPSKARSGHQISCSLVSLHFLCDILSGPPVN